MRLLSIIALCFDQDDLFLKQTIATVKESQSDPGAPVYFEATCEKFLLDLWTRQVKIRKEREAIESKQRDGRYSFFGSLIQDSTKQQIQQRTAKKILSDLLGHTVLPTGENYYNVASGKKAKVIIEKEVPRKVFVFTCGGGSFYEYEQIRNLNEQLGTLAFS